MVLPPDFFKSTGPCFMHLSVLLNGGDMPEVLNQTILVLIPKIANPDVLANLDQSHFAM
jgi:hypothetical protein